MIAKRATSNDLYAPEGAAELIDAQIMDLSMTGDRRPGEIASNIAACLREHIRRTKRGRYYDDNVRFLVGPLSNGRQLFAPDVSYHTIPRAATERRFLEGAPDFAVEMRSANDHGDVAELHLAAQRADYFEAEAKVAWDVDPVNETVWHVAVNEVFERINS